MLERHCADVGRDPGEIRRSTQLRFDPDDVEDTIRTLEAFYEAGFTENVIYLSSEGEPLRAAEIAAEQILPRFS